MQLICTHPPVRGQPNDVLIRCIEECYSCADLHLLCGCLSGRGQDRSHNASG
jgi:hypothetical protein